MKIQKYLFVDLFKLLTLKLSAIDRRFNCEVYRDTNHYPLLKEHFYIYKESETKYKSNILICKIKNNYCVYVYTYKL